MMRPSCCSVGLREDVTRIDADILAGGPENSIRRVAARYGVSPAAIQRHRHHIAGAESPASDPGDAPTDAGRYADDSADAVTLVEAEEARPPRSRFDVPNPGDDPKTAPRKLITADLELRCYDLRRRGKSYEEIAKIEGVHIETAMDAAERVLNRTRGKADALADRARELDLRRCDAIIDSLWDRALDPAMASVEVPANTETGFKDYEGQDKALDRVLKTLERRAKLLGLDAPTGPAVQVNVLQVAGVPELTRSLSSAVVTLFRLLAPEQEPRAVALYRALAEAIDAGDPLAMQDAAAWLEDRARVVEAPLLPEGRG